MNRTVDSETVVKYQFQADDEEWKAWKNTVLRSKSLEKRINELIEADTDGRVDDDDRVGEACGYLERAIEHREWGMVEDAIAELECDDE